MPCEKANNTTVANRTMNPSRIEAALLIFNLILKIRRSFVITHPGSRYFLASAE
jgi:hypothetical protein